MKKLLIIFIAIILYSCEEKIKITPIIIYKTYTNFWGSPMPECICKFGYKEYQDGETIIFEDSCIRYQLGDTVKKQTQEALMKKRN